MTSKAPFTLLGKTAEESFNVSDSSRIQPLSKHIQGLAKERSLGCVKRAPRPEEARTRESRNLGTKVRKMVRTGRDH